MLTGLCDHVDDLLRAVRGDEDAFNRFAEAERLGAYLRRGSIYPLRSGKPIPAAWQAGCFRSVQIDAVQLSERTSLAV